MDEKLNGYDTTHVNNFLYGKNVSILSYRLRKQIAQSSNIFGLPSFGIVSDTSVKTHQAISISLNLNLRVYVRRQELIAGVSKSKMSKRLTYKRN